MDGRARAAPAPRNAPARCSPCGARSRSPGCASASRVISRSRVTLATIEAAAIEATMASPWITAWQSQPTSMRSRPSTNTSLRPHRQRRHRARQRPQRGAQDVVAVDARGRREGDRHLGAGADLGVELLALFAVELLGIVEPARHALGIEDDGGGDHRAGERPPPASSQPATGQTPRFIAARSRRKVGRMSSSPSGRRAMANCGGATHAAMVRGDGAQVNARTICRCGDRGGTRRSVRQHQPAVSRTAEIPDCARPPRGVRRDRRNRRCSRPRTPSAACAQHSAPAATARATRHRPPPATRSSRPASTPRKPSAVLDRNLGILRPVRSRTRATGSRRRPRRTRRLRRPAPCGGSPAPHRTRCCGRGRRRRA